MTKTKERTKDLPFHILMCIAQNGEKSKWQIKEALNVSYAGIHKNIPSLIKNGLIKKVKEEPSAKNPKITVEYYDLTARGLLNILVYANPEELDKIAEAQKDKLLLFKVWRVFEENGLKDHIIKLMQRSLEALRETRFPEKLTEKENTYRMILEELQYHVFVRDFLRGDETVISICKMDPEIKDFLQKKTEEHIQIYMDLMKEAAIISKYLKEKK